MTEHLTKVFFDVYKGLPRQGPGDTDSTVRALSLMTKRPVHPLILDIGCGSGAQTLDLAQACECEIIALDKHRPFLGALQLKSVEMGISNRVRVVHADMTDLKYADRYFDIIWSEGAIYIIGFEKGLAEWRRLLKPRGYIAVTEISWLTADPPAEVREYWGKEYPAMQPVHSNLKIITDLGYSVVGYFTLPSSSWWNDYYTPLENRLNEKRQAYARDERALGIIEASQTEINIYRKYSDHYGYVFYVMQLP